MIVRMLSYPFDVGRSVMKSIVMVSHIPCGISLGLSGTLTGSLIFVVWQIAHPLMYALTNSVILGYVEDRVHNIMHSKNPKPKSSQSRP